MARATEILCNEYGVDHVDLNFGCPVPKVTRKVAARRCRTNATGCG